MTNRNPLPADWLVTERWEALQTLASDLKQGIKPAPEAVQWFTDAVANCQPQKPLDLVRAMGLFTHGRPRKVGVERACEKVGALRESGFGVVAACKIAAEEFGASWKTVYRWWSGTKEKGLDPDTQPNLKNTFNTCGECSCAHAAFQENLKGVRHE